MEDGHKLIQVKEKSRTRYKINNEFIPPRIIRQLEMRGLVKLEFEAYSIQAIAQDLFEMYEASEVSNGMEGEKAD